MVKKKGKGRSVKKNLQGKTEPEELVQAPHSFVIHRGLPGGYTDDITKDFRKVMAPFTATNLKERKKNTIKDFVAISAYLHVSHMCIFTRTELGMYLKICKIPRGPTLTFKVHDFTLARDVISSLKKQYVHKTMYDNSPLVVLNNFTGEGMQLKLIASTFQNMFPQINLRNVNLNTIKRCVLLNYNTTTKLIDFRHYAIKVIPVGISKGVKKVIQGKVPNLAKFDDISELLTKSALLSESEFEDDPNLHVTLPQKIASRGNIENNKSAIRLSELGPRLTIQLIKVEDGLLDGEVLFHELIEKTEEEKKLISKRREQRRKLKEKRKKQQDINTKKKLEKKEELKKKSLEGMNKGNTENDRLMKKAAEEANKEVKMDDDDDLEYYKQEVGEEPDKDLFTVNANKKRTLPPGVMKRKKQKLEAEERKSHSSNNDTKFKFKKKFDNTNDNKRFDGKGGKHKFGNKTRDKDGSTFKRKFDESRDNKRFGGKGGKNKFGNKTRGRDDSTFNNKKSKVFGSKIQKKKTRKR